MTSNIPRAWYLDEGVSKLLNESGLNSTSNSKKRECITCRAWERHCAEGFTHVSIMSYTAKYNSAYYGPFRDALASAPAEVSWCALETPAVLQLESAPQGFPRKKTKKIHATALKKLCVTITSYEPGFKQLTNCY